MSEFPGLEKWYLQKKSTLSLQDVALWQMLPPHPQRRELEVGQARANARARRAVQNEECYTASSALRAGIRAPFLSAMGTCLKLLLLSTLV